MLFDDGNDANGDEGNVSIAFHTVIENAIGTTGADTQIGNAWANRLEGGGGDDTLYGDGVVYDGAEGFTGVSDWDAADPNRTKPDAHADADTLLGGAGNDRLLGGAGNDTLDGGADVDTADYSKDPNAVNINLQTGVGIDGWGGTDTLINIENITGSRFNDTLRGTTARNTLSGGTGDDLFIGMEQITALAANLAGDRYIGSLGTDTVDYRNVNFALTAAVSTASISITRTSNPVSSELLMETENLLMTSNSDTLNVSGGPAVGVSRVFDGYFGTDTLHYVGSTGGVIRDDTQLAYYNIQGTGKDTFRRFETFDSYDGSGKWIAGVSASYVVPDVQQSYQVMASVVDYSTALTNMQLSMSPGNTTLFNQCAATFSGGASHFNAVGASPLTVIGTDHGDTVTVGGFFSGNTGLVYKSGYGNDAISVNPFSGVSIQYNGGYDTIVNGGAAIGIVPFTLAMGNGINPEDISTSFGQGTIGPSLLISVAGRGGILIDNLPSAVLTNGYAIRLASGEQMVLRPSSSLVTSAQTITSFTGRMGDDGMDGFNQANETFYGLAGHDVIRAMGGNDTVHGGDGNDEIDGGTGTDALFGNFGTDTFIVSSVAGNDTLGDFNGAEGDIIRFTDAGVTKNNMLTMRVGNDLILTTGTNNTTIQGFFSTFTGASKELLAEFPSGAETLAFDSAGKLLGVNSNIPTENDDDLQGTLSDDVISGLGGNDKISGLAGNDQLDGGDGNDELHGGTGNDILIGNSGNDTVYGEEGNDYIVAASGLGNDHYDGGSGIDTVEYSSASFGVMIDLRAGTASGPEVDSDTIVNVENVFASNGSDIIRGDGGNNILQGLAGGDIYVIGRDSGADTIIDVSIDGSTDRIFFDAGIMPEELIFSQSGEDMIISGFGGQVTIFKWFLTEDDQIEEFAFSNGLLFSAADATRAAVTNGHLDSAPTATPDNGAVFAAIEETIIEHNWASGTQMFPAVMERAKLTPPDLIKPFNRENLTLKDDHPVKVSFVTEGAGYKNSLGYYFVDQTTGKITNVGIMALNASGTGTGVFGGGSYGAGDVLKDFGTLPAGVEVAFFLIANGYSENSFFRKFDLDQGHFEFQNSKTGEAATIYDPAKKLDLVFVQETVNRHGETVTKEIDVRGDVFHASFKNLNTDGRLHAVSGINDEGNLQIGFEDLKGLGDGDYNDVIIEIEIPPVRDIFLHDVTVADDFQLTDADDNVITAATITLDNALVGDSLLLGGISTDAQGRIAGTNITLEQNNNALSLTGADTAENYESVIQFLAFHSSAEDPVAGDRNVTITVTDGDGLQDTAHYTVTIGDVGSLPPQMMALMADMGGDDVSLLSTGLTSTDYWHDVDFDAIEAGDYASLRQLLDSGDMLNVNNVLTGPDPVEDVINMMASAPASIDLPVTDAAETSGDASFYNASGLDGLLADVFDSQIQNAA